MFKIGGIFFMVVGSFLIYNGGKNTAGLVEYRLSTVTTTATVTKIKAYTTRSRWGETNRQKIVFTYERGARTVVDTICTEYSGNRYYNNKVPLQEVGNKLIVRYPEKPLFFNNSFVDNDHKQITTDGEFTEKVLSKATALFIGCGFFFIGFVFNWLFSSGKLEEIKANNEQKH